MDQQQLRRIVAGSTRIQSFLDLMESWADSVEDIDKPIKPLDSLEIRQAIRRFVLNELDLLRRIPNTIDKGSSIARRDDT